MSARGLACIVRDGAAVWRARRRATSSWTIAHPPSEMDASEVAGATRHSRACLLSGCSRRGLRRSHALHRRTVQREVEMIRGVAAVEAVPRAPTCPWHAGGTLGGATRGRMAPADSARARVPRVVGMGALAQSAASRLAAGGRGDGDGPAAKRWCERSEKRVQHTRARTHTNGVSLNRSRVDEGRGGAVAYEAPTRLAPSRVVVRLATAVPLRPCALATSCESGAAASVKARGRRQCPHRRGGLPGRCMLTDATEAEHAARLTRMCHTTLLSAFVRLVCAPSFRACG